MWMIINHTVDDYQILLARPPIFGLMAPAVNFVLRVELSRKDKGGKP
jgi:hypothetical protein